MLIKNLELKNYGAVKKANLKFKKGFNLISGENGQGKSHLIRALAYLLLNHTEAKIEDDCNWDANEFTISTLIEHKNKSFQIKTNYLEKSGAKKTLTIADDTNQSMYDSNKDVTETLAEYFDPSYCKPAIVSFQGDMDIVSAKPAERREYLKRIYNLDFSKEIEYLQQEIDSLNEEKLKREKQLFSLENKDYNYEETVEPKISSAQYKTAKNDYEQLRKKKEQIESEMKMYDQLLREVNGQKQILKDYEKEIDSLYKQIENDENGIQKLISELDDLTIENTIKPLEEQLSQIKFKRTVTFDEQLLEERSKEYHKKYGELVNIHETNLELVKNGKCPMCKREFHGTKIEEYQKAHYNCKKEVNALQEEISQLKEKKKKHDEIVRENEIFKSQRERLLSKIESEKEKIEYRKNNINSQLANANMSLMTDQETLENKKEKKRKLIDKIEELETSIPPMRPKLPINLKTNMDKLYHMYSEYEKILEKNKLIVERNQKIEKQEKQDLKEISELNKKIDLFITDINNYDKAVKILKKDFPNFIINKMKDELEGGMNSLLDEAYNGRYHVSIKENRSGLIITYGKKEKDIQLASGAEKNIFNIGFKNSFNELAGLGVLILDEALNFADDNIAQSVFNVIQKRLEEEKLNQVFVITHKDSVKKLLISDYDAKVYEVHEGEISLLEN